MPTRSSLWQVDPMRMRKVKWAVEYLPQSKVLVADPAENKGKWKELLQTDTLHVELGCGKGKYSLDMAAMNEQDGFVAVEKNESAAGIAARKMDEDGRDKKLRLIMGDADRIGEWFAPGEVDIIHLNFSDPWPKKRYAKRRLSAPSFLEQYKTVLSSQGKIIMKTDNAPLFEFSVPQFLSHGFSLEEMSVDFRREEHPEDAITEYEEKFIEQGKPIYRAVFEKEKA
ncbi:tRNA (guanosine(46)-N7)-methyltransferase TrmB [uncultured Dubosiella sp.]|uniref:tRNA (guanosine(46)-N7)-methyltransferase TrmB n=3 Tax=uncultured Dubosiella sp. TaxID=1937011 RepID=UPI00345EBAF4